MFPGVPAAGKTYNMKRGQVHRPTYYKTKDFTVPGTRVRMSSKHLFLQCFQTVPQHREARIDAVYFCPSPGNLCFRNVFEGFPITVVGRFFAQAETWNPIGPLGNVLVSQCFSH